ncbi:hypothetical protein C0J52_08265 [Blattella germanica]|nr:hypothetical protein C0J52_08265 [Blattella germanica]
MYVITCYTLYLSVLTILVENSSCLNMDQPGWENAKYHGRYTRDVDEYEIFIPQKVDHEGGFMSYSLPHFYKRNVSSRVKRSSNKDLHKIHYKLKFNGKDHHLEMWPNHAFISPGAMVEEHGSHDVSKIKIRRVNNTLCHYKGRVKGHNNSRLALSTCDGLVGYISTNHDHFFIEPVVGHDPQTDGQHLHMVYRRPLPKSHKFCGTDKRFLDYHNNTDYEIYILTIMNMASDFYHDESIGYQIDFVVVRIVYLFKEEKEFDLIINQDAESTLHSFCNWQASINPHDYSHPNHHDVAVLLTRYDICSDNMSECGLLGLAYVAEACNPNMSCAINEDTGLLLGVVVTHEVGHIMGCGHDNPDETGCQPNVDEHYSHVMSPYVQLATANWSSCSKKFIQEFLDNDLGDCLLDEPQDHNFKAIDMPPGAMYDATFQCKLTFKSPETEFCDQGPAKNCEVLYCTYAPNSCVTNGQPPADGTKCGNNMWCYNRMCVPIGERPEAVNGGWGDWNTWSECSRTCGGGIMFSERECNNPTPKFHGRYCLGERRQYRVCNTVPCDPEAPTFREKQCSEHDKNGESWRPFINKAPEDICKLLCMNSARMIMLLDPRVKDGTPCKPGTKNVCIAGKCRVIGCDWIIDSDAVEDQCGICSGDGTQCTIVEEVCNKTGNGYEKITVIPKGSTKITVEELQPIPNTLALTGTDETKFILNGDYTEENDEELRIAGTIGYYFHPEEDLEQIIISGPTTEDLVLFACFFSSNNPGIRYRYAIRTGNESTYLPRYHWEFLEWNDCDKRCGGGIQEAEPSCIEDKYGKVSDAFCAQLKKPNAKTRLCNEQPCKSFWKVGEWGKCDGHQRTRVVQCVKESPNEDEHIIDESNCGGNKPNDTELCNSSRPCNKRVKKSTEERSHLLNKKHQPSWVTKRWHFKFKHSGNMGKNSSVVKKHAYHEIEKQPKIKKIRMHRYHKIVEDEVNFEAHTPQSKPVSKIAKKVTNNHTENYKSLNIVQLDGKDPKQQMSENVKKVKMKEAEKFREHTPKGFQMNEVDLPNNGSEQKIMKNKDDLLVKKKPIGKDDVFIKKTKGKDNLFVKKKILAKDNLFLKKKVTGKDDKLNNKQPPLEEDKNYKVKCQDIQHNNTKQTEPIVEKTNNETCGLQNKIITVNETKPPNALKSKNDSCAIQIHGQTNGTIVKDSVSKNTLKVIEIPILEPKNDIVLSDEGIEALGDKLSDILDTKDEKVFEGEEAVQRLMGEVNNTMTSSKGNVCDFVAN